MRYSVRWLPAAEEELAALWLATTNRDAVTQAAFEIDQDLHIKADEIGESRPGGLRIHFVWPLGVLFRVIADDWMVQVVIVWSFQ
jgi:hypothetical protein